MNSAQTCVPANRHHREREFFNQAFTENTRAAATSKFYSITASSLAKYHALILEDCEGKKSLEVGCGPGGVTFNLAAAGATATAIDISDVAIETCRARAREKQINAAFVRMNAERTTFESASFDIICGNGVLHHLDLRKALAEFARVIKQDGRAVFLEPLGHNGIINLYRRLTPALRTVDEHPLLMSDLTLAREYFAQVEVNFYHFTSLAAVPFRSTKAFDRLNTVFSGLDEWLFRAFPRSCKYAWIAVLDLRQPRSNAGPSA
jgi:ubiquinone/menaquinone biosynthesis C-methylase UbiE